jgi:hypothetical protein
MKGCNRTRSHQANNVGGRTFGLSGGLRGRRKDAKGNYGFVYHLDMLMAEVALVAEWNGKLP